MDSQSNALPGSDHTQHKKILIVDDRGEDRRMMRFALERNGYAVSEATTGEEGLQCAAASPPDLILLDINLGGRMDGWDVLRRLKADYKTSSIPVIIVSGVDYSGDCEVRLDARAAGAHDYLIKPFDLSELFMRIQRGLLSRERTESEESAAV